MTADPPRRSDNRCACGCGRPVPGVPKLRQKGIPDEAYLTEPFATSECCKAWHGVKIAGYSETSGLDSPKGRRRAVAA